MRAPSARGAAGHEPHAHGEGIEGFLTPSAPVMDGRESAESASVLTITGGNEKNYLTKNQRIEFSVIQKETDTLVGLFLGDLSAPCTPQTVDL